MEAANGNARDDSLTRRLIKRYPAYQGVLGIFATYWRGYGGWAALRDSPYLHLSGLLTLCCFGSWSQPDWWEKVFSVLPNLVGFSIGAFAIFLGVGGESFQSRIAGADSSNPKSISPFISAAAAFTHFIVVQVLAIVVALVFASLHKVALPVSLSWAHSLNEYGRQVAWFLGMWLFLYALTLTIGTVMVIFRTAGWFDEYAAAKRAREEQKSGVED